MHLTKVISIILFLVVSTIHSFPQPETTTDNHNIVLSDSSNNITRIFPLDASNNYSTAFNISVPSNFSAEIVVDEYGDLEANDNSTGSASEELALDVDLARGKRNVEERNYETTTDYHNIVLSDLSNNITRIFPLDASNNYSTAFNISVPSNFSADIVVDEYGDFEANDNSTDSVSEELTLDVDLPRNKRAVEASNEETTTDDHNIVLTDSSNNITRNFPLDASNNYSTAFNISVPSNASAEIVIDVNDDYDSTNNSTDAASDELTIDIDVPRYKREIEGSHGENTTRIVLQNQSNNNTKTIPLKTSKNTATSSDSSGDIIVDAYGDFIDHSNSSESDDELTIAVELPRNKKAVELLILPEEFVEEENYEGMALAESIIFRPLFAYRKSYEQRRRG